MLATVKTTSLLLLRRSTSIIVKHRLIRPCPRVIQPAQPGHCKVARPPPLKKAPPVRHALRQIARRWAGLLVKVSLVMIMQHLGETCWTLDNVGDRVLRFACRPACRKEVHCRREAAGRIWKTRNNSHEFASAGAKRTIGGSLGRGLIHKNLEFPRRNPSSPPQRTKVSPRHLMHKRGMETTFAGRHPGDVRT